MPPGTTKPRVRVRFAHKTSQKKTREKTPQPLLTSLFLRNSWLLPGFGIMIDDFSAGGVEQQRSRGADAGLHSSVSKPWPGLRIWTLPARSDGDMMSRREVQKMLWKSGGDRITLSS